MQRIRSFHHFLLEASSQEIQTLAQRLQSEADSEKMRIGGTADKVEWAMRFVVLNAFVQQLQDDLAKGKTEAPNYAEDLYNGIDGRSTDLKNKAIELMKMNGLSNEAADELQVTPTEPEGTDDGTENDSDLKYDDGRDAYVDQKTGRVGPNGPKNPIPTEAQPEKISLGEAKNWSFVKLVPGTLHGEKKKKRRVKPKSPAERAFRTAFNHARNEARKVLEPKLNEPQQPAEATAPQPQANPQTQLGV